MSPITTANAAFESLNAHSTHDRLVAVGHLCLAAGEECAVPDMARKYQDRADECFARARRLAA